MNRSQQLFEEAKHYIPGGVNSPVRAFSHVGGTPVYLKKAAGAYIIDEDDNSYVDYVGSWGPMIAGHAHPKVLKAVADKIQDGLSFGAPTEIETMLAKKIQEFLPSMELIRMVSSGTEATMSAIRLARGFTNRSKLIKFEGCYHGHSDSLLVKAGSGLLTFGAPSSPGVPAELTQHTICLTYNDSEQIKEVFSKMGEEIACVIVEPIAGNMNCIPPHPEFLQTLREQCTKYGAILIFDEVMTGFRVHKGSAQGLYNIKPDLTTLGKIIGGGMPVGAFGGRRDIMNCLSPIGAVYQAGTLSGNPVAMSAGLATLEIISAPNFYDELMQKTSTFVKGVEAVFANSNHAFSTNHVCGMFGLFFSNEKVSNFKQATSCDIEKFKRFFHACLKEGVYFAPSAYEAGFMSMAHTDKEFDFTYAAIEKVLKTL